MKHLLDRIMPLLSPDITRGWHTIDVDLSHDDLMADLDPGWIAWRRELEGGSDRVRAA